MSEEAFPPGVVAEAVTAGRALLRADSGEDAVLAIMAASALGLAEAFLGQRLIVRGFGDTVAADGGWHRLSAEPVVVVTAGGFAVDIDADGVGWVRASGGGTVVVAYRAGTGDAWDVLPPTIRQGVALLVQHLFEHREGDATPPAAIAALWRPWRRVRIGGGRR